LDYVLVDITLLNICDRLYGSSKYNHGMLEAQSKSNSSHNHIPQHRKNGSTMLSNFIHQIKW
jgi:hypothetical protein